MRLRAVGAVLQGYAPSSNNAAPLRHYLEPLPTQAAADTLEEPILRSLIVKFGAIGDVLMLVPAAHQLHLAGHRVDWLCGPSVLPILQLYPWIHPIVADEQGLLLGSAPARLRALAGMWRAVAGPAYDQVAIFYYDPRYRLISLPLRARRKITLSHEDRRTRLLPGRHHTDEFARILLDRPDGLTPTQLAPVPAPGLPASPLPHSGRPRVLLVPAGARNLLADDALRRWPADHYVALAQALLTQGLEVILIGGPGDQWVQPLFSHLPVMDFIGRHSLVQTLALMQDADVVVTHDTGPLHLAGITQAGIVALFGPTDPRGRIPQRPGTVALWGGEGFACRPCYDGHSFPACPANDCLRQLSPQMVAAEVLAMIAGRARGHLAPARIAFPPSTMPAAHIAPPVVFLP